LFAGRKWQSQKQAEEAWKANLGRNWEPKLRAAEERAAQMEAEVQALRAALTGGGGQGQGAARGAQPTQATDPNAPLAKRLVQSGDLDFLVDMLQTRDGEDPSLGVKRFTAGLADIIDKRIGEAVERDRNEHLQPFLQRTAQERAVASTMGSIRALAQHFPELDESNASPEAVEHQQAFVENFKRFPPEMHRDAPDFVALATALVTRWQYGVPVFAQPPGTSGSPSAAAIAASAHALGQATPDTLSGTGTPRQRPNGQPESAEERIRRENAAAPGRFRSPNGVDLGFGPA
jgi:hypothetical protein